MNLYEYPIIPLVLLLKVDITIPPTYEISGGVLESDSQSGGRSLRR